MRAGVWRWSDGPADGRQRRGIGGQARAGSGVLLQPAELIEPEIAAGRLVRVLPKYAAPAGPLHLLYPAVIYAGATVLGRITVGAGSTIEGNVWLTESVPAGSNVSQARNRSE